MTSRRTVRSAIALLCGAPMLASAQASAPFVALRDADAPLLVRLVRLELREADDAMRRGTESARQSAEAFTNRVALANTGDPLAYVKAHTSHYVVPQDARYDAACSRELSQTQLYPVAVFALGKAATDVEDALRRKGTTELSQRDMWNIMRAQGSSSAGTAMSAGMRFYSAHGFALDGEVTSSADYRWHEPGRDSLRVSVTMINHGAGLGLPACTKMGNIATILLSVGDEPSGLGGSGVRHSAPTTTGADDSFDAALRRAGLSAERYEVMRTSALDAFVNARSPETLDVLEQIAAQEHNAEDRRTIGVQRQNLAWYKRHSAELEPVFKQIAPR